MQSRTLELLLASQSPRRREMFAWLGLSFQAMEARVDESPLPGEAPAAMAVRLARTKACAGNGLATASLILAADTVVELDGVALGKPENATEARSMLTALRGREHEVHTGVALWNARSGQLSLRCVTTTVTMRAYSDTEIAMYIGTGDPFDKAGAYAIQHAGFNPVTCLNLCYANVVGLPLCTVLALLNESTARTGLDDALAICKERFGYPCPGPDWGKNSINQGNPP